MAEQNLERIQNALKYYYLPALQNQLNTEPSALLAQIKKPTCQSDFIKSVAPVGLSGGFGFSSEGAPTPAAGGVRYQDFLTRTRDMYVNIEISNKAVELAKGKADSVINALQAELTAAKDTASWNIGRALFGNGTGKLATVKKAQQSAGTTIAVDSPKNLIEGLTVDIYAASGTTPAVAGARIEFVSHAKNSDGFYEITIDKTPAAAVALNSFITVQGSYNKELTGIGAIMDDSVTTLYGVTKADKPIIKPVVESAENDITDAIITNTLRRAEREKNSKVDLILCGDVAYDAYCSYLRTNQVRVEATTKMLEGGFKAINFTFGNRDVSIVNEKFVPDAEMWGVETGKLKLHQTGWDFMALQGGGIFNLKEETSVYRAVMANYGDLICENPGGLIRIIECDPA